MMDFPVLRGGTSKEVLFNFYLDLGFNTNLKLHPSMVIVNSKDQKIFCDHIKSKNKTEGERQEAVTLFLMYGPSASKDVPVNKVLLKKGWMTEEK